MVGKREVRRPKSEIRRKSEGRILNRRSEEGLDGGPTPNLEHRASNIEHPTSNRRKLGHGKMGGDLLALLRIRVRVRRLEWNGFGGGRPRLGPGQCRRRSGGCAGASRGESLLRAGAGRRARSDNGSGSSRRKEQCDR